VSMTGDSERGQEGFSLVELMIVVAILAVLIAIAIPTFLGLRARAESRAVHSRLRDALIAARTFQSDDVSFTGFDAAEGEDIEPSLQWADGPANVARQVNVEAATSDDITLTAMTPSGEIYCLAWSSTAANGRVQGRGDAATYADCVALPDW
jgi:type IV pilus assembly protein PilA